MTEIDQLRAQLNGALQAEAATRRERDVARAAHLAALAERDEARRLLELRRDLHDVDRAAAFRCGDAERERDEARAERDLAAAERDEFMRQRDRAAEALMAAERTLADVQRLPELPWAEVSASLMQRFAAVARSGHQHDAQALMAVLDKGKTFVVRIEAERDRAKRERDAALREADRLRHGAPVEGDFVCPNERDAREARGQVAALQAEFDAMNRADYTEQECPTCGQKP